VKLCFLGAVRTVTGSMHLLEANGKRVLLDCGLFQGHREESNRRNRQLPFEPRSNDGGVHSNGDIVMSGNIQKLDRQGFRGPVHTTRASGDLCAALLRDSAYILEQDAGSGTSTCAAGSSRSSRSMTPRTSAASWRR
jgi:metallo-beta-lactamase family protein